jgi:hypothetical protein
MNIAKSPLAVLPSSPVRAILDGLLTRAVHRDR